jgi:hypothetical protein
MFAEHVTLSVSPDKLVRLKQALEDQRDVIRAWLAHNRERLRVIPSPGNDPCSRDTTAAFGANGDSATRAAASYVGELSSVIRKLHECAIAYGLTEDDNKGKFPQEPS